MRTLARTFASLILVSAASTASAAFIELDLLAPGDRLITRDTDLGLDWLDVYVTRNTSADQIRGGAGGWIADGWRHATTTETCSLMIRLLPPGTNCPGVNFSADSVSSLTSLLSTDPDYIAGYFADDSSSNVVGLVEARNYLSGGSSWAVYAIGAVGSWTSAPAEGNFLVRPIPEPSTAPLLALGLLGLAYRQRRNGPAWQIHALRQGNQLRNCVRLLWVPLLVSSLFLARAASAVTVDWVTVGDPGNTGDTRYYVSPGYGAVDYAYQIAKYETTNAQYAVFLNAVAAADPNELFDGRMEADNTNGGITRSGTSGNYSYSVKSGFADRPVNYVTPYDARRFANWLNNGQPTGAQGSGTTEDGAYTLLGGTPIPSNALTIVRNAGASIFLTSENEWYKAAYYDSALGVYFDYPTGTNAVTACVSPGSDTGNSANCLPTPTPPSVFVTDVGAYLLSESPYGTYDQGGNLFEWNETMNGECWGFRGGSFKDGGAEDMVASNTYSICGTNGEVHFGFRVANVIPEPSTSLLVMTGLLALAYRQRRNGLTSRGGESVPRSLRQIIVVVLLLPIPKVALAVSEAWLIVSGSSYGTVKSYDFAGNYLSSFDFGSPIAEITIVNGEIWEAERGNSSGRINRYDFARNFLGSFNVGQSVADVTLVGSEAWVSAQGNSNGPIFRYGFDGNLLGTFNVGQSVESITLVNGEAWLAAAGSPYGTVLRYGLAGDYLSSYNYGSPIADIALVNGEAWLAEDGNPYGGVRRYGLDGNFLSSFNVGQSIGDITVVDDEVWLVGFGDSNGPIFRYDLGGNILGAFNAGTSIASITVVPEPGTGLLVMVGLLGLAYRHRWSRRTP